MSYYIPTVPSAKNINNLTNNVDNRLTQRSKTNTYHYPKKQNNMKIYPYKNLGNYRNNSIITSSAQLNQNYLSNNAQLSNYELRKIIKEEFESLIRPFEQEVFKKMKDLEEKIEKKDKNEKMAICTMRNDIKNVKGEVQEMKNKYQEIEELNIVEDKKYYNDIERDKNEEKLKENEDKISFLQKNFEKLR